MNLRKPLSVRLPQPIAILALAALLGAFVNVNQAAASPFEPPDLERIENSLTTGSAGIAWGDPDGAHAMYAWPFNIPILHMGHLNNSYQDYGGAPYFHHGIDPLVPDGTPVYTRSGGQVVNVENYSPGSALYWEVAILDEEGYVWQYHHINRVTIPQAITDAYTAYLANPESGGMVAANSHIGNIVYWTEVSFGVRFNHLHLNILADEDIYLNPLEFLDGSVNIDTQPPVIQEVGLLSGNTLLSGNLISFGSDYSLYVRARDLHQSSIFYLPPSKIQFQVDGGPLTTVWDFHSLPGGSNEEAYVDDYYIPGATCGDYDCRDFYIDLGFTREGQREFPSLPGIHRIEVSAWDHAYNLTKHQFLWIVTYPMADNDCANSGLSLTHVVEETLTVTDVNIRLLVEHPDRGQLRLEVKAPGNISPVIVVAPSADGHASYNVKIDDASSAPLNDGNDDRVTPPYFQRTAGPGVNGSLDSFNNLPAKGTWTISLCDAVAGKVGTVYALELEIIGVENATPLAHPQQLAIPALGALDITLTGSDPEAADLSYEVTTLPAHGVLSGTAPNLVYLPESGFIGEDEFYFTVSDGSLPSEPARVAIHVTPRFVYLPITLNLK